MHMQTSHFKIVSCEYTYLTDELLTLVTVLTDLMYEN